MFGYEIAIKFMFIFKLFTACQVGLSKNVNSPDHMHIPERAAFFMLFLASVIKYQFRATAWTVRKTKSFFIKRACQRS